MSNEKEMVIRCKKHFWCIFCRINWFEHATIEVHIPSRVNCEMYLLDVGLKMIVGYWIVLKSGLVGNCGTRKLALQSKVDKSPAFRFR